MKAPILSRTACYMRLRDGTLRHLDWNIVNTTLGAMIEPRSLVRAGGNIQNADPYDSAFTDIAILSEGEAATAGLIGRSGGDLWPRVYNTQ